MSQLRPLLGTLKAAAKGWSDDNVTLHSSSLAYYTVFSIAPLLVIAMATAGFVLGQKASHGQILKRCKDSSGAAAHRRCKAWFKAPRLSLIRAFWPRSLGS